MLNISGIYPALVTPYTEDDKINDNALVDLVHMLINEGAEGFYVNGSTAECHLLDEEERKHIAEIVCAEAKGKAHTIIHVGSTSTKLSSRLALHAAGCGADAISSLPPFYYKYGFPEILDHYESVAAAAGIPMIVYNIPSLSGVSLTVEQIKKLAENPLIKGIKFTSYDLFQLERIKSALPGFIVFNGHDEVFLPSLTLGVDGAIGSTYNFMINKFLKIRGYFNEKKTDSALKEQREANTVIEALLSVGIFPGIKYILELKGINCNGCRKPMKRFLSEEEKRSIDKIIPLICL